MIHTNNPETNLMELKHRLEVGLMLDAIYMVLAPLDYRHGVESIYGMEIIRSDEVVQPMLVIDYYKLNKKLKGGLALIAEWENEND